MFIMISVKKKTIKITQVDATTEKAQVVMLFDPNANTQAVP